MTEENFNYRTSPLFLRNEFNSTDEWKMPIIPKPNSDTLFIDDLRVIGFDKVKSGNDRHFNRLVHFFLYDYNFEKIWTEPEKYLNTLNKYRGILSPDFSMYIEMNPVMQLYNTFRNRWVGAYFANRGIKVIPTVNWGLENTFDFCFNGIERGSVVAVSTYMVVEHGHHKDQKEFFLRGYNEMLKRIDPELVICYNTPFPEMEGDIIYIDYDLSSWRHYNDDEIKTYRKNNPQVITKYNSGYVVSCGTGSAFGGEWQPKKPEDERFLGEPGEIKITYTKNGEMYETKIGNDGKAEKERHHTTHNRVHTAHTDPHDHQITWENGFPYLESPINYSDGNAPKFKNFKGEYYMGKNILSNSLEENRFKSVSDFKWCIKCGGEVEFVWKGKAYSITHPDGKINLGEGCYLDSNGIYRNVKTKEPCVDVDGMYADTADEILECILDGDKLRDIITEIEVEVRTI